MQELYLFILTFLFVLVIYEFFIVLRAKKTKKNKKKDSPVEVSYLVSRYKLNLKKLNYNRLLQVIAFVSSFDIALTVSVIMMFKSLLWQMILGFFMIMITIIVSYHIVYLVYKKRGMVDDES